MFLSFLAAIQAEKDFLLQGSQTTGKKTDNCVKMNAR
jgi:hypothetical protein